MVIVTDNVGAIFMFENALTGVRTRHVDTGYDFIQEFIEDRFIQIDLIRSKKNGSNLFTKTMT
jgi:hypothetical protein